MRYYQKCSLILSFLLCLILSFSQPLFAVDDPAKNPGSVSPAPNMLSQEQEATSTKVMPVRLAPGVYKIGKVELDKSKRSISFPVRVNMDKGLLEYLVVRTGGKTHESLFLTDAEPFNIQLAGLLLNMEGADKPIPYQGASEVPTGERLKLSVAVVDGQGRTQHYSPETWLKKVIDDKAEPVENLDWIFTGSVISNGRFLAQMEGSIIALYRDPVAIVDNASPGGDNDEIWFVNGEMVPKVGTKAVLTIQIAK